MRRTVRPNTHRFLVVVISAIAILIWALWVLGRSHTTWRAVAVLMSGLTFAFFALGWSTR